MGQNKGSWAGHQAVPGEPVWVMEGRKLRERSGPRMYL